MKNITLILLLAMGSFLFGCDRDTLQGLNLKIDAEVKSDYDEAANQTQDGQLNQTQTASKETQTAQEIAQIASEGEKIEDSSEPETSATPAKKIPDPDPAIPFQEISDCSESGIRAKTNEIFYADKSQVKSIDSKNKQEVKAWKKIYQKVAKTCN